MLEVLESRLLLCAPWFVAPAGSDGGLGTLASPFKTIQHAAVLAQPGDTVYLRAGTYHETVTPAHSGTSSAPIVYEPYNNETVTIDGADALSGWSAVAGSKTIFSAPQSWDLGTGNNELFLNGVAMNEAQWPNTAVGAVQPATAAMNSVYTSAIGPGWEYADTATISVSNLPGAPGAWDGATIHFGAGQDWVVQTGTVLNSGNGTITFAYEHQTSYETPVAGNRFYLTGKYLGLDAAGEWYHDPTTGKTYLWTPSGASPAGYTVEAKHRQYAVDLSNRSYIDIRNIHIIAATINTNSASTHDSITGLTAKYVSQQMLHTFGWTNEAPTTGILLLGSSNLLENSTITDSSGNGVYVGGSSNTVQNCTISYIDYSGSDEAGITVVGTSNRLVSNVIHDTGRDAILDTNAIAATIEYNTIYTVGHQTTDLGAIYGFGTDSHGTVIAYNNISNISAGGFSAAAIYLDNGSADYIIHNNTITNAQIAIKLNAPSFNNSVYNNVINGKNVASQSSGGGSLVGKAATYKGTLATLAVVGTLGGFRSNGFGINSAGQVVGASLNGRAQIGFRYSAGTLSSIDPYGTYVEPATAINAAGQIAGYAYTSTGHPMAYLDTAGKIQNLGTLTGDQSSYATSINSAGEVAGVSYGADGIGNAFAYYSGAMHALPTLGGHVSEAFGVNTSGIVVGESTVAGDLDARAVEWSAGKAINLGTLGGRSSYALAVNGSGQIAGASQISSGAFHAFLYTNGVMHDIGTLAGYKNAIATGINSQGEIVGYAYNADTSQSHAWVYRNGVMTDLNNLTPAGTGWTLTDAPSINDNQQITGSAGGSNGLTEAYILTL